MANDYYNHGSAPANNALGSSSEMRAEFDSINTACNKLAPLTGNANKLLLVNSGGTAQTTKAADAVIADTVHAATGKTTPVDADEVGIVDSAASNVLKKVTWANIKATLKAYFDTLYQTAGSFVTLGGALGTPSSGTLTNCTGLPTTGISSTTGSGSAVLATSPTINSPALVTPSLGTPVSGTLSGCTGYPFNSLNFGAAPTISSGFGTGPSVVNSNGALTFVVNIGSGGTASAGVLAMPTAPNGWRGFCVQHGSTGAPEADKITLAATSTVNTLSLQCRNVSTGNPVAWGANSYVEVIAVPY